MNPDPTPLDEVDLSQTRPSDARGQAVAQTLLSGSSVNTTLPEVRWAAGAPVIEQRALRRYETLETLGRGGMGEVVKARDNDIGRTVALKRLHRHHQSPELYARFVEEVRTVGQLEHPNIVPIHDAGLDAEGCFFVMKHVDGESLQAIIARLAAGDRATHAQWPFERRVAVMHKTIEAVRYAHSKGIVHRDLKPANILIGPLGEVFVLDWGIAHRDRGEVRPVPPSAEAGAPAASEAASLETQAGAVMCTPQYMSPEQARGEPVDARSDLYSLCVVFFEFLTLTHPYARLSSLAEVLEAVRTVDVPLAGFVKNSFQPKVPMDLSWLLRKGTRKEVTARFQSAADLLRRLDDRAMGRVPVECHVTAVERLGYEAMRLINRFPLGFLFALLGGVGLAVYLVFAQG
jgi:serine/threonine protein kinase